MINLLKNYKKQLLLICGILVLAIFIFRQYIFDGYFFLSKGTWSDLLRANLPAYYHMYDNLIKGGNFWSWEMGIGTSMFSHADIYFDPFTYVLFIFGRDYIPNMMICSFILKLVAEGLSFFFYINYFKIDKRAASITSIIYAFSGYSLITGNNFVLGTILVYAPMIFLGIEKWIDTGKARLLILGIFLTCIYSYYFFYVTGIFSAVYLCFRLYQKKEKVSKKLMLLAGIAVLVIMLSSFALLPQLEVVLSSSRTNAGKDVHFGINLFKPQFKAWATALIRSLSNDILGNTTTNSYLGHAYYGIKDFFQMSCYSSAFLVILLTQFMHYNRNRIRHCALIFVFFSILTIFPFFSYIFNAFSTVNARWMYVITIAQCIGIGFSIDSILKHKKIHESSLLTGIILSDLIIICSIIILSIDGSNTITLLKQFAVTASNYVFFIVFLHIAFCSILLLQKNQQIKNKKYFIGLIVIVLLCIDEGINYYQCYGIKESVCNYSEAEKTSYEDTSAAMIRDITDTDQTFYRINKTFDSVYDRNGIPSENDAMVQRYFGLKNYNSLNNSNYIEFLQNMGIYVTLPSARDYFIANGIPPKSVTGQHLNYIDGVGDRYHVMSYLGVKYLLTDNPLLALPENFIQNSYSAAHINCYENLNAYPLAFSNSKIMSLDEFMQLSDADKDFALLEYTILEKTNTTKSILETDEKIISNNAKKKQNAFELLSFKPDKIKFNILIDKNQEYLSTSIPYDKNWNIFIDGKKAESCKLNIALLGAKITSGLHSVELQYVPKQFILGILFSITTFLILCLVLAYQHRTAAKKRELNT